MTLTGNTAIDISIVVFAVLLFPYLCGPFLIWFTQRFNRNFTMEPVDPQDPSLPLEIREFFSQTYQTIRPLGFRYHSLYLVPDLIENVSTIFAIYENREDRSLALTASVYAASPDGLVRIRDQHAQFACAFENGQVYSVNNCQQIGAFGIVPHRIVHAFRKTQDAAELFQLFRVGRHDLGQRSKTLPPVNEMHLLVKKNLLDELESQFSIGYLKPTSDQSKIAPTFLGACVMVWTNLFPGRQYCLWKDAKFEREICEKKARMFGTSYS